MLWLGRELFSHGQYRLQPRKKPMCVFGGRGVGSQLLESLVHPALVSGERGPIGGDTDVALTSGLLTLAEIAA